MILWKHNLFKWSVTILLARSPGLQSRRMLGEHSTIPKLLALSLTWKRCQSLILDEKINQRLWQSMNTSIPMTSKFGEKNVGHFGADTFKKNCQEHLKPFCCYSSASKDIWMRCSKKKPFMDLHSPLSPFFAQSASIP